MAVPLTPSETGSQQVDPELLEAFPERLRQVVLESSGTAAAEMAKQAAAASNARETVLRIVRENLPAMEAQRTAMLASASAARSVMQDAVRDALPGVRAARERMLASLRTPGRRRLAPPRRFMRREPRVARRRRAGTQAQRTRAPSRPPEEPDPDIVRGGRR